MLCLCVCLVFAFALSTPFLIAHHSSFIAPSSLPLFIIRLRFGMEGTIAETHFDMNRNMVSIIRGRKRYIIQTPDQCENVYFYGNPSRVCERAAVCV